MCIENLTEESADLAINLLNVLRNSAKARTLIDTEDEITCDDVMTDRGEWLACLHRAKQERIDARRKADFKRLLTACTKLIVNEA